MKKQHSVSTIVKIGTSRQVVIPKKIHDQLGLTPGAYLEVELLAHKVIFTPKILVDKRIAEGLNNVKHGRVSARFRSARSLVRSLRSRKNRQFVNARSVHRALS